MKIERVIEIEERDIQEIIDYRNGEHIGPLRYEIASNAFEAIAKSKPYEERPQGDLISRSEVMKLIPEVIGGQNEFADCIRDSVKQVIDTATTIEVPERPKGKWVEFGVNNQGTYYKCSKCGFVVRDFPETITTTYPFCTCGADMRGEKE